MKIKNIFKVAFLSAALILPVNIFAKGEDEIVTLGRDLTLNQRDEILQEMNATEDAKIIEVTNEEEYQYLGDVLTSKEIGNKAISSAIVRYTKEGSGINIEISPNIVVVSESSYRNAMTTAGVKDADVYVTAPGKVSGTAALTGILKSYEETSGKKIPEDVKKVANEELVLQTKLSEDIGEEKTNDVINIVKSEMAAKMPQSKEEVRQIVDTVNTNYNLGLSDSAKDGLTTLFNNMKNADIDWKLVANKVGEYSKKANEFLNSPQGEKAVKDTKNFIEKIIDFLVSLFK